MNYHAPVPPGGGAGGQPAGVTPWHLWGTTDVLRMTSTGVGTPAVVRSQQLVKVDYKHPTTWAFFFHVQMNQTVPAINELFVDFAVMLGVGRSNARIDPFCRFGFSAADMLDGAKNYRFADSVQARELDPYATIYTPAPNFIRNLPAETINIEASLHSTGAQDAGEYSAIVTAFVAPLVHVRPDWFEQQFKGEIGGS